MFAEKIIKIKMGFNEKQFKTIVKTLEGLAKSRQHASETDSEHLKARREAHDFIQGTAESAEQQQKLTRFYDKLVEIMGGHERDCNYCESKTSFEYGGLHHDNNTPKFLVLLCNLCRDVKYLAIE